MTAAAELGADLGYESLEKPLSFSFTITETRVPATLPGREARSSISSSLAPASSTILWVMTAIVILPSA